MIQVERYLRREVVGRARAVELKKAVENGTIKPGRAVVLGCGAGTNSIYLAAKGFDVTAIMRPFDNPYLNDYVVRTRGQGGLKLVYKKDLGMGFEARSVVHQMGIAYASPVLAGKHVYVFGMDGTTVVLKPGRKYEEVARNKIEDMTWPNHWRQKPEGFASTPVARGECLYIRGDKYLYCIGR